ncbi:hypothetical protein Ga0074812_12740 [Parafrankia irregularis]|uniref:Uncharacterized protein n=1 Tax=Parafrankia irregularis TaxID=795642 RepID=A0A0S4QV33_9ACTN|nr:hypothetical protein Ga0074812_12740 [Parafrankia irregularis]
MRRLFSARRVVVLAALALLAALAGPATAASAAAPGQLILCSNGGYDFL